MFNLIHLFKKNSNRHLTGTHLEKVFPARRSLWLPRADRSGPAGEGFPGRLIRQGRLIASLIPAVLTVLIFPSMVWAAYVTLAWSPGTPAPEGYRIFHRTTDGTYNYEAPAWSGSATKCYISDLADNTTYYFVVRAFEGPYESSDSNEVSYRTKATGPSIDSDNDGMPDGWESLFDLDPYRKDADLDKDDDGLTNHEEYIGGSDPTVAMGNQPPVRPTILYPGDDKLAVELRPQLSSGEFTDPDPEDRHTQTRWRITTADDGQIVLDVTVDMDQLTAVKVPYLVLDPETIYFCEIRHYDNHGLASEWSEPAYFITTATTGDQDNNGIQDDQEAASPVDLNTDGIPDAQQLEIIKSVQTANPLYLMGVSSQDSQADIDLELVSAVDPNAVDMPADAFDWSPYGLLAYRIQVTQPGQSATVTVHFSEQIDSQIEWVQYDSINGWMDSNDQVDVNPDGLAVTRALVDGGLSDADGVANGVIINTFGPSSPQSDDDHGNGNTNQQGAGSSGFGCFIESLL